MGKHCRRPVSHGDRGRLGLRSVLHRDGATYRRKWYLRGSNGGRDDGKRTDSTAMGEFTKADAGNTTAMGSNASTNSHPGTFVYGDASSASELRATADNQFVVRAQHLWLGTNNIVTSTDGRFLETSTGAYLSSGGAWTNVSDVNRKHLFQPVSGEDVLSRLAAMPVQKWSYKAEAASVQHLGPTAQDFFSAFHLGESETAIATVDADGVSLIAIQALEKRTQELRVDNVRLTAELDALRAANAHLLARFELLEAALARTENRQP